MFKKSDYFILAAVMLSFLVSAFQWFVQQDIDQAIFTAIWVPSILALGALILPPPGGPKS